MTQPRDPAAETASMVANMKKNTGKTLEEWVEIAKGSGKQKHGEIVKFLKENHGIGHGFANLVAHTVNQSAAVIMNKDERGDLIDQHYAKGKEHLRPIYDKLVEIIKGFGGDVEFVPMKTYVSVRRNKQIACIGPATKTRFEVGIKLPKGHASTERLTEGGYNGMVSHLVKVTDASEIDPELVGWLKEAYDAG